MNILDGCDADVVVGMSLGWKVHAAIFYAWFSCENCMMIGWAGGATVLFLSKSMSELH